jgi:Fe2+ or Zn2+ uptake regulation protein
MVTEEIRSGVTEEANPVFTSVIRALDSPLRVALVKILQERPRSAPDIYQTLINTGFDIGDRDTVYKALQMLVDANLLEKYYDMNVKRICYKVATKQILIDIPTLNLTVTP